MRHLPVLVLCGLMLAACSKKEAPAEPVRPVLFTTAKEQSQEQLGRFAGSIQARYESVLGFRVSGRIAQRYVDVGSEVEKGTLLASLDPIDQQNQLRAAQGDLAKVQAQLINAQANARRQQQLFDRGVGAQAQLDAARTDLSTTKASVDQAQAAVDQAKDQLAYIELRNDHAAVVTQWHAEAGEVVSAGQGVVTLARPDVKEAVIDLPATLAEQLPVGLEFIVAAQLDPSINTTATLREIEPQAESTTRTRRARLTLATTPEGFRLGSAISVTLSSSIEPHTEVPLTALLERDGEVRVWVIDMQAKTVSTRVVKVASRGPGTALLTSGIKPGEHVVTAGVNSLKEGQKVKVDEEAVR
ncbi:efflux RND transporter periplasmic adaptor subunit [Pseudomonas akapageensis]|uniref:efflux RND transporter periplasmic adaptor subunit n=1 Tax=Pseudomonas akapageensis TaxID=2609961 RepID=UPI00140A77D1|nr:efflux RND transporter periplasmic adaptor subunit [Pseudomonas akapageensis]